MYTSTIGPAGANLKKVTSHNQTVAYDIDRI